MKLTPTLGRVTDPSLSSFKSGLKSGEILKGTVVRVLGNNQFLINFKGQKLVTEVESRLSRGQEVEAKVISLKGGVRMSFVPTEKMPPKFDSEITSLLNDAGLPFNQRHLDFAQILYQNQTPIDSCIVIDFAEYAQKADSLSRTNHNTNLLFTSWLLNFPPKSHLFQALKNLYYRQDKLDQRLKLLQNELRALAKDSTISFGSKNELSQQIMEATRSIAPNSNNLAEEIAKFVNQLGLSYERKLFLAGQKSNASETFLQRNNLKSDLIRLKIQLGSDKQYSDELLGRIGKAIDSVLCQIDALELAMNPLITGRSQVYFQIPYSGNKKDLSAEVLGYNLDDQDKLDTENMRLEMSIETENLGNLKFDLRIKKRHMNCLIMSEKQQYNNFIVDEKIDLLERMKSIRYNLEDVAFQVVDSRRIRVDVVTDVSQTTVNMGRIDVSA